MILGWEQTKPPDPPNFIGIDVTSTNSSNLRIQESSDGPIATKFKGNTIHFHNHSLFIGHLCVKSIDAKKNNNTSTHMWNDKIETYEKTMVVLSQCGRYGLFISYHPHINKEKLNSV